MFISLNDIYVYIVIYRGYHKKSHLSRKKEGGGRAAAPFTTRLLVSYWRYFAGGLVHGTVSGVPRTMGCVDLDLRVRDASASDSRGCPELKYVICSCHNGLL